MNYEMLINKIIKIKFSSPVAIRALVLLNEKCADISEPISVTMQEMGDILSVNKSRIRDAVNELESKNIISISKQGKRNIYKFVV